RILPRRLRQPRGGDRGGARDGARRMRCLRDPPLEAVLGRHGQAGGAGGVTDLAWIDTALKSARPQALGALLRYFRDLDRAEEAFQEACLRALKNWPVNGPPRDPAGWLILVGRNSALDELRRRNRTEPLPPDEGISDLDDA